MELNRYVTDGHTISNGDSHMGIFSAVSAVSVLNDLVTENDKLKRELVSIKRSLATVEPVVQYVCDIVTNYEDLASSTGLSIDRESKTWHQTVYNAYEIIESSAQ